MDTERGLVGAPRLARGSCLESSHPQVSRHRRLLQRQRQRRADPLRRVARFDDDAGQSIVEVWFPHRHPVQVSLSSAGQHPGELLLVPGGDNHQEVAAFQPLAHQCRESCGERESAVNSLRSLEAGAQITACDDIQSVEMVRAVGVLGERHEGKIRRADEEVNNHDRTAARE
jgi:hypothetical protein